MNDTSTFTTTSASSFRRRGAAGATPLLRKLNISYQGLFCTVCKIRGCSSWRRGRSLSLSIDYAGATTSIRTPAALRLSAQRLPPAFCCSASGSSGLLRISYEEAQMGHSSVAAMPDFISSWIPRPTPPRGGATTASPSASASAVFQFTPPRGGRPSRRRSPSCRPNFNSRPRAGGRQAGLRRIAFTRRFQFTPPRGGRLQVRQNVAHRRDFNSRPRAGGDLHRPP